MSESITAPIFILGIMQRSGTGFIHRLLCQHPDCAEGGAIREDYLLEHSDLLIKYSQLSYKRWNPGWEIENKVGPPDLLFRCLGDGLISFLGHQFTSDKSSDPECLSVHSTKRIVSKTPSVIHLNHFFKLFPDACLVIIIRDGRGVVESGAKSFDWDYERAIRRWAKAARSILDFCNNPDNTGKYRLVKYEDLNDNTEEELRGLFSFLGLEASKYDFDSVIDLPVEGSSDTRRDKESKVHWKPEKKTSDFKGTCRWSSWSRNLHERFNWIAGDCQVKLGYDKQIYDGGCLRRICLNIILDIKWCAREIWRRFWLRRMFWAIINRWR